MLWLWLSRTLGISLGVVQIGLLGVAYVVLSLIVRARRRKLGLLPARATRVAIWVGIVWVNVPLLPIFILPLAIQRWGRPDANALVSALLLLLGFFSAWAWWSVNVSLWRRWAARRGVAARELQIEGVSAQLLWPKGHFFEHTEYDRLRAVIGKSRSRSEG